VKKMKNKNNTDRLIKVRTKDGRYDWVKESMVPFWQYKGYVVESVEVEGMAVQSVEKN